MTKRNTYHTKFPVEAIQLLTTEDQDEICNLIDDGVKIRKTLSVSGYIDGIGVQFNRDDYLILKFGRPFMAMGEFDFEDLFERIITIEV